MTHPTTARTPATLRASLASWVGLALCAGLIGWLSWLLKYGYAAELARCGRMPDQYYPEIVWFALLFPMGLSAMLSIAGVLLAKRMGGWTWLLLAPATLIIVSGAWLAWMGADGCAIRFER